MGVEKRSQNQDSHTTDMNPMQQTDECIPQIKSKTIPACVTKRKRRGEIGTKHEEIEKMEEDV